MLYAIIALSILLVLSLAWNWIQFKTLVGMNNLVHALYPCAAAADELVGFLVNASHGEGTARGIEVRIHGEEIADMYVTRLNAVAHALQFASGHEKTDVAVYQGTRDDDDLEDPTTRDY